MELKKLRKLIFKALEDLKAEEILELDVQDKTNIADYLIIASGTSSRHVRAIANNVAFEAKNNGVTILGVEGESESEWVLVDAGDVVVHVMQPSIREFYDLESLWKVTVPVLVDSA